MKWLTIDINYPVLDVAIIAKKVSQFGYGPFYEIFEFTADKFTQEEAADYLKANGNYEWWKRVEEL